MEPDLPTMLERCDGGLLIGDPALLAFRSVANQDLYVYDLAEEWKAFTGKDFVFAFWAVRAEAGADSRVAAAFQRSRDHGLQPASIAAISREWSVRLSIPEPDVESYLTQHIYYKLDAGCLDGLNLFYRYAHECGVLPSTPPLRFL